MIKDNDGLASEDSVCVTIMPASVSSNTINGGGSGGGGCIIQTIMS
jgi:hypothetical protein